MNESEEILKQQHSSCLIGGLTLVCPRTKEPLQKTESGCQSSGGINYRITDSGKYIFVDTSAYDSKSKDVVVRTKEMGKRILGRYYRLLVIAISPTFPRIDWLRMRTVLGSLIEKYIGHDPAIQIGSGNNRVGRGLVNIDSELYDEVDIVADAASLPFGDESINGVVNVSLLEHTVNPDVILRECHRVLKDNGIIITNVPFIAGFHGSPTDYYRWTEAGIVELHARNGFKKIELVREGGPTASLIWVMQEWLAILFSFGSEKIYLVLWVMAGVVLAPLKLLDVVLVFYPEAHKISHASILVARKATISDGGTK